MSLKIENSRRVAESRPVCMDMDLKRQVDPARSQLKGPGDEVEVDVKLHDLVTVYNMIETDCKHIFKKTMFLLYLHQRPLFQFHIYNPHTGC
jgi:hypothetical protein